MNIADSFALKHSHGLTENHASYAEALAAVALVYTDCLIGHPGDISEGGESTLVWTDATSTENDDGSRAIAKIVARHCCSTTSEPKNKQATYRMVHALIPDRWIAIAWNYEQGVMLATGDHETYSAARDELGKMCSASNVDLRWFDGEYEIENGEVMYQKGTTPR